MPSLPADASAVDVSLSIVIDGAILSRPPTGTARWVRGVASALSDLPNVRSVLARGPSLFTRWGRIHRIPNLLQERWWYDRTLPEFARRAKFDAMLMPANLTARRGVIPQVVTILDVNLTRLRYLDDVFGPALKTRYSEAVAIDELARDADLVIGAVLIPGKQAPKLLKRATVEAMKRGSVFVDIAIDQGGCAETSRPTSHSEPTYTEAGVVHYCVTNMPAACARTATLALTNATLPYALELAGKGYRQALEDNPGLRDGLNVHLGVVTQQNVAADLGYDWVPPEQILEELGRGAARTTPASSRRVQ